MDGRMWKNVKDNSVVKNLKAITSFEELEKVLKYIQNMQSENIRTLVSEQFDMLPPDFVIAYPKILRQRV